MSGDLCQLQEVDILGFYNKSSVKNRKELLDGQGSGCRV